MFEYSELIKNLAVKEFKLRYRNSVLGFFWSLLNPLAMMLILTLVFSTMVRSGIKNFPVFLLPALLVWRFFSIGTTMSLGSILGNAPLVTNVYLPRWLLVLSSNMANLIGSGLEFLVLFPLLIIMGMELSYLALILPIILAIEFVLIMGVSFLLASLNVYYRDINQVWDIILQAGFFLTPIIYSVNLIPPRYQSLYLLNPVSRIMETVRKILYYNILPTPGDFIIPLLGGIIFCILGFQVFRMLEPRFAEVV